MSFGVPAQLGSCPHNVLNALAKRHLTRPPNKAEPVDYNLFTNNGVVRDAFVEGYHEFMQVGNLDAWKADKGLPKLRKIELSKAMQRPKHQDIVAFVKREVQAAMPKKSQADTR